MSHICKSCRIDGHWCLCDVQPLVNNATNVSVIIHASDYQKSSNTGRLLGRVLKNSRMFIHGTLNAPLPCDAELTQNSLPLILFPGRQAKPLTDQRLDWLKEQRRERDISLIIPDGNWNQATHMMKRIPLLASSMAIELTPEDLSDRRMRQNKFAGRMSTFEAAAKVLGLLEGAEVERPLLDYYDKFVGRMLMMRGKLKSSDLVT